jgi:hypothetical protein
MSLLCKLFGHQVSTGYGNVKGAGYFSVRVTETDGIGRVHADIYDVCEWCGVKYRIGKIHVPPTDQ